MYVTVARLWLAQKHLARKNLESIRHSKSIVLPSAKSMAFHKQIFMNFDSPCMACDNSNAVANIALCALPYF